MKKYLCVQNGLTPTRPYLSIQTQANIKSPPKNTKLQQYILSNNANLNKNIRSRQSHNKNTFFNQCFKRKYNNNTEFKDAKIKANYLVPKNRDKKQFTNSIVQSCIQSKKKIYVKCQNFMIDLANTNHIQRSNSIKTKNNQQIDINRFESFSTNKIKSNDPRSINYTNSRYPNQKNKNLHYTSDSRQRKVNLYVEGVKNIMSEKLYPNLIERIHDQNTAQQQHAQQNEKQIDHDSSDLRVDTKQTITQICKQSRKSSKKIIFKGQRRQYIYRFQDYVSNDRPFHHKKQTIAENAQYEQGEQFYLKNKAYL